MCPMCPIGAHSGAHPIMFIKMNKIELKDLDEIIYHDETESHHGLCADLSPINSNHGLYTLNIVYPIGCKSAYFNKHGRI